MSELRKLVNLIIASFTSFVWSAVMLAGIIYGLAVFFTQATVFADAHRRLSGDQADIPDHDHDSGMNTMSSRFGTISRSGKSLFMAITGGVDWEEIIVPLNSSPVLYFIFFAYVTFSIFVVLNLVTGIFVDGAMHLNNQDKERVIAKLVTKSFGDPDLGMEFDEFLNIALDPRFEDFWIATGLRADVAGDIFRYITGGVKDVLSVEGLAHGAVKVQQPAKVQDVMLLLRQFKFAEYSELERENARTFYFSSGARDSRDMRNSVTSYSSE
jgi:hypothetical protein